MSSAQNQQEDLEARIARIKKRNEEIEKKHREAEADRLMAMKENAMVEMKPPKDEDWPREHKYDKIDFTYDLDEEALAELEAKKKEKNAFIQKIAKDYKVFAEGEGPPPDPAYSFLADVERDGEKAPLPGSNNIQGRMNNKGGNFDRKNPNNRSGRLGSGPGPGGIRGGGSGAGRGGLRGGFGGNLQRSQSTNEHDGRRPDHTRHGGHKNGAPGPLNDSKWRREGAGSKDDGCINNFSNGGYKGEPNLTVSVSQDGEFKSVKVTSPPIIGSGRVGPRQPAKPQFQFQTDPHNPHHHQNLGAGKPHHRSNNENFNRNASGRKSDKDAKRLPKPGSGGGPSPSPSSSSSSANASNKSTNGGGSLQDRLNRNRVVNIDRNENTIRVSTSGSAAEAGAGTHAKANATLKTISKIIEKNAEIDEKLARQMHHENERMVNRMKELRMQD
ncbi:uncharacterized protein LOC129745184 [Uranotaenia lowii]|uniref:uncharacterized protein LOC129745178 n=1 Tax=Uranotaenia lowii TaxID=190385 RepID=UPI002478A5AC|nr:uncharacterized protein LOC129745178 [Uranotaenia lowii]XP_055594084.1 uncharacterized protein LOC129745184 [Uranotaenia lowii]